jgi:hopene-associated glycosyltransferase HpnB
MSFGPLGIIALTGLGAWLYLALGRHGFWRASERLAADLPAPAAWPPIVAIIPARNEAAFIARSLKSVADQDFKGSLRVILVDDSSTDNTARIARRVRGQAPIEVVVAPPLADGWSGKLWAQENGIRYAEKTGRMPTDAFLWFADADTVHGAGVLRALVQKAAAEKRDLVSLMVRLNAEGLWGGFLVPAFVFFFQKLYPFPDVGREGGRSAAAAGGCLLVRYSLLEAAGGIAAIHGALIDDCALARRLKEAGGRLWLGLADDSRSLRPYAFGDLWRMVKRTAYTQLDHSILRLLGTVAAMVFTYLVPPIILLSLPLHGDVPAAGAGLAAWLVMIGLYAPTLTYYDRSPLEGVLLPLVGGLYTLMTIHSALDHWRGHGSHWKARDYNPG